MKQIYSFHQSVRGYNHIINDIICEDASDSYSDKDKRYHIAIIADGHGAKECFRSSSGSKFIVEVTKECLEGFANSILESSDKEKRFYKDMFNNTQYEKMAIEDLTNTIVDKWHKRVKEDYENNPPTTEELENLKELSENSNIFHIYGTTLIAALMLPQCLIILQQGDGRAVVFYKDGKINQPIPWDLRCEDNVTTSMCDEDVKKSIRHCIINLDLHDVMACYLGSDGVEDAYRDTYESISGMHTLMGGVNTFYKDLSCNIVTMEATQISQYLAEMLPEFSEKGRFSPSGSGDDISIAGIVNIKSLENYVKSFEIDIKYYTLEEEMLIKDSKLQSMRRKHEILHKRMTDDEKAIKELKIKLLGIEKQTKEESQLKERLEKQIKEKQVEVEQINFELADKQKRIENLHSILNPLSKKIKETRNKHEIIQKHLENNKSNLDICDKKITKLNDSYKKENNKIIEAQEKYNDTKKKYNDYHEVFQIIEREREEILNKMKALSIQTEYKEN